MRISEELKLGINAALKAGEVIMEIYKSDNFDIEIKSDNSPISKADKAAHITIKSYLEKFTFPILSEEGLEIPYDYRKNWNRFWMVDPIDGTKEFLKRNGEFTVNIALIENKKPILGIVYAPALKDLYFAEEKIGAFKMNNIITFKDTLESELIDLSKSFYPKIYTLVVSKSHMNQETQLFVEQKENELGEIRKASFGSSLKLCKVAEGNAHCYPRFGPTMEWDTAAAHAICKFAGCRVFNPENSMELIYNKKDLKNPYFIVASERIK